MDFCAHNQVHGGRWTGGPLWGPRGTGWLQLWPSTGPGLARWGRGTVMGGSGGPDWTGMPRTFHHSLPLG